MVARNKVTTSGRTELYAQTLGPVLKTARQKQYLTMMLNTLEKKDLFDSAFTLADVRRPVPDGSTYGQRYERYARHFAYQEAQYFLDLFVTIGILTLVSDGTPSKKKYALASSGALEAHQAEYSKGIEFFRRVPFIVQYTTEGWKALVQTKGLTTEQMKVFTDQVMSTDTFIEHTNSYPESKVSK